MLPFNQLTNKTFSESFEALSSGGRLTGITGSGVNLSTLKKSIESAGFKDVKVQFGIGQNAGVEFSGIKP